MYTRANCQSKTLRVKRAATTPTPISHTYMDAGGSTSIPHAHAYPQSLLSPTRTLTVGTYIMPHNHPPDAGPTQDPPPTAYLPVGLGMQDPELPEQHPRQQSAQSGILDL